MLGLLGRERWRCKIVSCNLGLLCTKQFIVYIDFLGKGFDRNVIDVSKISVCTNNVDKIFGNGNNFVSDVFRQLLLLLLFLRIWR